MRNTLLATSLLVAVCLSPAFASKSEDSLCTDLRKMGATPWLGPALYYRDKNGLPVVIRDRAVLPSDIQSFFYYVRANTDQFDKPSILNIKLVFRTSQRVQKRKYVDVRNDRWDNYSDERRRQIAEDCSKVDPEGYEHYHLGNGRNFCLRRHFHQQSPVDTLASPSRKASFAFGDMLFETRPDLVASIGSLFFTPAKAADRSTNTEASLSHIKSWIRNFSFSQSVDKCVEIQPHIPSGVDSLHLRVTYHATTIDSEPSARDWRVSFEK